MLTKFLPFCGAWIKSDTDLKSAQTEALAILEKRREIEQIFANAPIKPAIVVRGENCRVIFK